MNKIAVHTPTKKDWKRLTKAMEKYTDWVWTGGGEKPTEYEDHNKYKEDSCIDFFKEGYRGDGIGFASKAWCEEENYTIITVDEAINKLKNLLMKTFEPNKTATELGIDLTRKFVVDDTHPRFNEGDIVCYSSEREGDGSWVYFKRCSDGQIEPCYWYRLAYAEDEHPLKAGDVIILAHNDREKTVLSVTDTHLTATNADDGYECGDVRYSCWELARKNLASGFWKIKGAEERTAQDVLADLSEDDKKIIESAMK